MLLSVANLKKEHIGCLVTFWFSTSVIIYSTTMSLVWFKSTQRWMLRWLIHSGCLVTFWFDTLTTQLWVLLVLNTQRWMVHCYEGLFISLQLRDFGIIIYIVCPCYPYDMNCTCNATDLWGKPLATGWLWYTYCFSVMHNTQTIRGLPIRSLIRLFWWRSACIAIAWATIGTLEGETRIIKNPVKCVDDSSYLSKTNNHTIN